MCCYSIFLNHKKKYEQQIQNRKMSENIFDLIYVLTSSAVKRRRTNIQEYRIKQHDNIKWQNQLTIFSYGK